MAEKGVELCAGFGSIDRVEDKEVGEQKVEETLDLCATE